MRYRKLNLNLRRAGWWIIPLGVLILLCTPELRSAGVVSLRLLCLGGVVMVVSSYYSKQGHSVLRLGDEFSGEEAACRRRLLSLTRQLRAVEAAAHEVRCEFRRTSERRSMESVRDALEQRLIELKSAMARERAVQYSLHAARWQGRIEPLLRELEWLDTDFDAADAPSLERWVQARLDRVNCLRPVGARLEARLRSDTEAAALPSGMMLSALLRQELGELQTFRADLLMLRTELMACNRPSEADQPDPEFLVLQLKMTRQRLRMRRDERNSPTEATATVLRRNRTTGSAPPLPASVLSRQEPRRGPAPAPYTSPGA